MFIFEWTILMLLTAVVLSAVARRIGVPYPAFLALAGAAIAFLPQAPPLRLDPELVLALFVAPVLLDAAYDTSIRDLKRNWVAVTSLAVVAVLVTTGAVAVVCRLLVPDMSWAVAIALGAIVAPPDAAAATAVLRQVNLPRRILTILEGESLLNDATALLIFRVAVAATLVGTFEPRHVGPTFLIVVAGSIAVGWAIARLFMFATRRVQDAPSSIVLQFVGTFGVWLLADRVGLSGILTVVVYGIVIARTAPAKVPARLRIPSYAVWETIVFILNVLAFLLIGLQLRPLWQRLNYHQRVRYTIVAIALVITVVVARFAWVAVYLAAVKLKVRLIGRRKKRPTIVPTWRGGLLVSWCGMRGIVTLAAALALPTQDDHGKPFYFPQRDLIEFCAFAVVFATLVFQGFTLRPLLKRLKLEDDGCAQQELDYARTRAIEAALDALKDDTSPEAGLLRDEYALALRQSQDDGNGSIGPRLDSEPRRKAVTASRAALVTARSKGEIGDEAFHRIEENLDWMEMSAGGRVESSR